MLDSRWDSQDGNYVRKTLGDQHGPALNRRLDLRLVSVGHVLPSVPLAVEFHTRGDSSRAHAHSHRYSDRDNNCDTDQGPGESRGRGRRQRRRQGNRSFAAVTEADRTRPGFAGASGQARRGRVEGSHLCVHSDGFGPAAMRKLQQTALDRIGQSMSAVVRAAHASWGGWRAARYRRYRVRRMRYRPIATAEWCGEMARYGPFDLYRILQWFSFQQPSGIRSRLLRARLVFV
jgi:hypothetical protein